MNTEKGCVCCGTLYISKVKLLLSVYSCFKSNQIKSRLFICCRPLAINKTRETTVAVLNMICIQITWYKVHSVTVLMLVKMLSTSFLNALTLLENVLRCFVQLNFHPLSLNKVLFGDEHLSFQDNKILFKRIQTYIKSTRRFNNPDE